MTGTDQHMIDELRTLALTLEAPALQPLRKKIVAGIERLNAPMQVAIIGKIKASKSTLVNAIIGKPEFAPTGELEVTWNVSWIKHGKANSATEVYFKDGTTTNIPTEQWRNIATGDTNGTGGRINGKSIKSDISYISLFDDSPILNDINIIDTPGLEANRQLDSQNTIDFLSGVCRPDAIITLFVHNATQNMVGVVEEFVGAGGTLTPLNSIGVMAKFDMQWNLAYWNKNMLHEMQKVANRQLATQDALRKNIFRIYPVCALMFMAAQTLTDEQTEALRTLALLKEETLKSTLPFAPKFMTSTDLPLSIPMRKVLLEQIGQYGIRLAVQLLQANPNATRRDICAMFRQESGADALMRAVYNHFGARSNLLKAQSLYQDLCSECMRLMQHPQVGVQMNGTKILLDKIFHDVIYEIKEYSILSDIYDGKVTYLSDTEIGEFRNLCGENGSDAHSRLGQVENISPLDLYKEAMQRARTCRRKSQNSFMSSQRNVLQLMQEGYLRLAEQIQIHIRQFNISQHFLFRDNQDV